MGYGVVVSDQNLRLRNFTHTQSVLWVVRMRLCVHSCNNITKHKSSIQCSQRGITIYVLPVTAGRIIKLMQ